MPSMEIAKGNEQYDAAEQSRNAFERQIKRKPKREQHVFMLTVGAESPVIIPADSDSDAWAHWCDKNQRWPSRRASNVVIQDLGTITEYEKKRAKNRELAKLEMETNPDPAAAAEKARELASDGLDGI